MKTKTGLEIIHKGKRIEVYTQKELQKKCDKLDARCDILTFIFGFIVCLMISCLIYNLL